MNKDRRTRIEKIIATLEPLENGDIADLAQEEQEAFENLSEGLQQSDQGQRTEASAGALQEAESAFEELITKLREAVEQ